jgi:PAS domain S-box-containing protein
MDLYYYIKMTFESLSQGNNSSPARHKNGVLLKVRCFSLLVLIAVFIISISLPAGVYAYGNKVRIGVLAHRGYDETLKIWTPTAAYLTAKIPQYSFKIVPLAYREIIPAVQQGAVDFVLANTSIYVELERFHGASRILTLKNTYNKYTFINMGGVILCRNDRQDIRTLNDLKGKSFMGVEETSLGGWQAALLELEKKGINPYRDFKSLQFGGTHDKVVYAVRDGRVDVGTVRTDTLEHMADEGLIDLRDFRILNQQYAEGFPFVLSTTLYPEGPFAKVRHTPDELAQKVAIVLLGIQPDSPAAKAAKIAGWTTPLDYQSVHELMKELRVGPYRDYEKITLARVLRTYWYLFVFGLAGLVLLGLFTSYVIRLNRKLKQSHEFTTTILNSMNDTISIIDVRDFKIVGGNSVFLKEFGEDAIGKKCYEITHHRPDVCQPPDDSCPLMATISNGDHAVAEHVHYGKNGEKIYVEVSTSPIKDNDGNIRQVVHISRDITDRKLTENALSESHVELQKSSRETEDARNKLENALDELSFLIQQVTERRDFSIRFSNPNIKKCYEIMNCVKKDCPCYGQEARRCWQIAGTFCGGKVQGFFADKFGNCSKCKTFKDAISDPIYHIGEHFNNMMHILEVQHRELENAYAELKSAQSKVLQQEKMASIGQLAAGVAHEINNPIGFIMSNFSTLQKYLDRLSAFIKAQSEAIHENINDTEKQGTGERGNRIKELKKSLKIDYILEDLDNLIHESLDGAERVKKIVQNLKSFARLDEAGQQMADINEGLESTINIVWNELKYKATVTKDYADIPMTKCNPGQLNQVFMNILINAAHAIEKQGEITVKTWSDNGYIYVSISDTGCGIPQDKINRIFEPFFTTKDVGKGTGLGLSISYDIIKKHSGEINVESEVDRGTTFTIKIPVNK